MMRRELECVLNQARNLPAEELPELMGDLETVRATCLARLAAPVASSAAPDELLEVPEASHRLGVSPDYLYRHHDRLPFTRRQGRKLLFSARGIEQHIAQKRPARTRKDSLTA